MNNGRTGTCQADSGSNPAGRSECKAHREGGRVRGYKLSDETLVSKPEAVSMAKQGQIAGVGIAHRGDSEYLKAIPNGDENDNLGNLPSVSPQSGG